jgi:hypothetical protein
MSSVKLYTADESDTKYFKINDLSGESVVTSLGIDGTTLTVEEMDPYSGEAGSYTLTLPSGGGGSLDTYTKSISYTSNSVTYTNVSSGTESSKTLNFKYVRRSFGSLSAVSVTTSTTNSSWTLLGSFSRGSYYEGQEVLVKFKSSGDYGGVMISTQNSSSPSETNTGVIGIMTLPASRWGTYSFSTPDSSTYYVYGMACSNVSVKRRIISTTNQNCAIS